MSFRISTGAIVALVVLVLGLAYLQAAAGECTQTVIQISPFSTTL